MIKTLQYIQKYYHLLRKIYSSYTSLWMVNSYDKLNANCQDWQSLPFLFCFICLFICVFFCLETSWGQGFS